MQPFGGFGQPAPTPPAGFGAQQPGGFAAFGASPAPFGAAQPPQPAAPPAAGGFGFGQQPQQPPAASGFGFGQQPQQPPAASGFGGFSAQPAPAPAQPASLFSFGAQPQQAQQPTQAPAAGFSAFGQPQPSPIPAAGGGFQQQAAALQQALSPASFSFGQGAAQPAAAAPAFGQPAQAAPAPFGSAAPVAGTLFGKAAAAASPGFSGFGAPAEQQKPLAAPAFGTGAPKFDFGAAARKQPAAAGGPIAARAQKPAAVAAVEGDGEEEAPFDYEAEKRKALASMPTFAGAAGGGAAAGSLARATGLAPPRAKSPSPAAAAGSAGLDAEEQARRAQRAARFVAPTPAPRAPSPPPSAARPPSAAGSARAFGGGGGGMRRVPSSLGQPGAMEEGDMEGEGEEEGGGAQRGAIVGTCEDMCPEQERVRRQGMNDIQIFERDPADPSTTNAGLAVKRFARTVDDPHPSEFRTRGALQRTMQHLRGILDRSDVRLGLVHKFLWDRYRSVRQDLYIQGIQDEFAVRIFEEIVRFHILSEHELCAEDQSVTDMEGFNSHLNMEQMNKALISLNDMYNKLAAAGAPIDTEAEFRAYHLLSLMSQHGKFKGDQQVLLSTIKGLRPEVKSSSAVQWVLSLQQAFASNNSVRFFALVRQAPYLLACLAHTYFPQMRKRALRMLSETLCPTSNKPVPLELSWIQSTMMMDSLEEAAQLCTTYGFDLASDNGTPVALLLKGGFTEREAPVVRKRSQLISSMAAGTRSAVVTTPALPPMSAEEAAEYEQRRAQLLARQQEAAEAARQQMAAEAARRQQAAAAAAEAARQAQLQEEQQRRRAEEERQAQLQRAAEAQRAQAAEAQRQAQLAEARRLQEEAAARRAAEEAQQRQQEERQRWLAEQARQAAEAEHARQEAVRREQQAREAERRRREEEERRRLAELQRQEEERRQRRAAKQRQARAKLYFARWRAQAARLAEERLRQQRLRASLKACRVGFTSARTPQVAAATTGSAEQALSDVHINQQGMAAQQAQQGAAGLDLPSLVAPLLVRRSPGADPLYWKVVVLAGGPASAAQQAQQGAAQQLSVLSRWLALQLSRGRLAASASGSTYIEGPISLQVSNGLGARLSTCVVLPHSLQGQHSAALAGASAAILPVGPGSRPAQLAQVLEVVPAGVRLPVLLVAPTPQLAQQWQGLVQGVGSPELTAMVHVISVQPPASFADHSSPANGALPNSSSSSNDGSAPVFSSQQLVQGIRWLAARAPQQPNLEVGSLETAAREGLGLVLAALHKDPSASAQDYIAAYNSTLQLVADGVRSAQQSTPSTWQWPPLELCPPSLRQWHAASTTAHLLESLAAVHISGNQLPPGTGTGQQAAMALYHRLGALDRLAPPLILPSEVQAQLRKRLKEAAAEAAAAVSQRQRRALAAPGPRGAANGAAVGYRRPSAGPVAAGAAAAGPAPLAPQLKRKWEPDTGHASAGQKRPSSAGQPVQQQDGKQQLHSALQRLQQQLSQEQQVEQQLSAQARGLSGTAISDRTIAVGAGGSSAWGGGAGPLKANPWQAAASSAPAPVAPSVMGDLAALLQAEKEAAASLKVHLEAAALF